MFLLVIKTDLHLETSGSRYGLKFFPSPLNIRSRGRRKWPFWILYLHVSHGEINIPLSHPDVKTIFRMEKYASHKTTITVARKLIQGLIPQPAFNPSLSSLRTHPLWLLPKESISFLLLCSVDNHFANPQWETNAAKQTNKRKVIPRVEGREVSCLGGSAVSLVRWCKKAFLKVASYPAKDGDFILRKTSISEKPE